MITVSTDKMKILQRLENGEITAAEALAMIGQFEKPADPPPPPSQQTPPPPPPDWGHHHDAFNEAPDWVSDIAGWVGNLVGDIADDIKDMEVPVNISDFFGGTYSRNKRTETFISNPISQSLAKLELHGKNDKIDIHVYDGDSVRIDCAYDARRHDDYVQFHEENGTIGLFFDDKAMRSVKVVCQVPRVHIGELLAMTKNAEITLSGLVADDVQLITKNANVFIEAVTTKELVAESRNANIKARGIAGGNIQLTTTNAKISVEEIRARELIIKTTNAGVKTEFLDAEHLRINTTNAGLKLEKALVGGLTQGFWDGERRIEAYTTNGNIRFGIPADMGVKLNAHASGGKITSDIPLYYSENMKSKVVGESVNYAASGRRMIVSLGTTNASVKLREV